jgi:hypothetical protein
MSWVKYLTTDSQKIIKHLHTNNININITPLIPLIQIIRDKYKAVCKKNFKIELYKDNNIKRRLTDVTVDNPFAPTNVKSQMTKMKSPVYKIGPIIVCGVDKHKIIGNKTYESAICRTLIMINFTPIDTLPIPLIIPTNIRKIFPPSEQPLTIDTMNSGMTASDLAEVYVMRAEEMNKVLVHELIHGLHFGIPHTSQEHHDKNTLDCNILAIECNDKHFLDEAYTETLAALLNCIFSAAEFVFIHNRRVDIIQTTEQMLKYEIAFAIYQVGHVMTHFSFNKFEDFLHATSNHTMKQTSDALSYYIFKAALLFSLNDFFTFIKNNNITYLKFNADTHIIKSFHNLIYKSMNNPEFISAVNINIGKKLLNSGRMTVIELK